MKRGKKVTSRSPVFFLTSTIFVFSVLHSYLVQWVTKVATYAFLRKTWKQKHFCGPLYKFITYNRGNLP